MTNIDISFDLEFELGIADSTVESTATLSQIGGKGPVTEMLTRDLDSFRSVFETLPDAVFLYDLYDDQLIDANQVACVMVGYTRDELLVINPSTLHPEITDLRGLARSTSELGFKTLENFAFRTKAGEIIRAEVSGSRLVFEGRDSLMLHVRDVANNRRLEEALDRARQDLYEFIENNPDGLLIVQDGRIAHVNASLMETLGYSSQDHMLEEPVVELVHPADRSIFRLNLRILRETGVIKSSARYRFVREDGELVYVQIVNARYIEFQNAPALMIVARDVSDIDQTEQALTESQEQWRSLVENAKDVIMTVGPQGDIRFLNHAFLDMEPGEAIGASFLDFLSQPDSETLRERMDLVLSTDGPEDCEITVYGSSGTVTPFMIRISPIKWEGRVVAFNFICVDITEQRRLQEQLNQSQKLEAVGRLAGGIAHDFNNMLTAIIGYAQLLAYRFGDDDTSARYVAGISKAADSAVSLTSQLLTFSRNQITSPRVIDVNKLILGMDGMIRRLISEDVELVTLTDQSASRVKVDPHQIEQVLMNLVVNAVDAMPNGGKLAIRTCNVSVQDDDDIRKGTNLRPGEYVVISVTDTGTGVPDDIAPRIFEPFFTTKDVGEGTGLGLAICYGIAVQSGGHITMTSKVGEETTFTTYLPRVREVLMPEKRTSDNPDKLHGDETILLVEDDALVREMSCTILKEFGYTILEASNGIDALSLIGKNPGDVDLLLTDIVMPLMSGRELAETVRDISPDVKILYSSGYSSDEILRSEATLENVAFLQKPFTLSALTEKVREILDR